MSEEKRTIGNTGFQVSEDMMGYASTGTHLVAGFIPSPAIGGVVDLIASTIDKETAQLNFIKIWKHAIAKHLHVSEAELEGDQGIALVGARLEELPLSIRSEWEKSEDIAGKTVNFLASGWAQIAGGAVIGSIAGSFIPLPPIGTIIGFAGGAGAGYVASTMMKDAQGDVDELTATEVIPAIHQAAMQSAGKGKEAATIDETLLGAYLIAAHSGKGGVLEDYNSDDLKRMFNEHVAARASGDTSQTELDKYIHELNVSADNPFALLLPKQVDGAKIQAGGVLGTIAKNMHSQDDLENWLFDPKVTQAQLSKHADHQGKIADMRPVVEAGRGLRGAMQHEVQAGHGMPTKSREGLHLG